MAAPTTFDQVINGLSVNGYGQKRPFYKATVATNVAFVWHSLWKGTGQPQAGGDPTKGLAGAAVCTSATQGALVQIVNPGGGRTLHLGWTKAMTAGAAGAVLYLVDRICHARLDRNQATGSLSPVLDATSRLATGEGGQLILEITTQLGTTATSRTFSYTDQDGNAGTTPTITDVASGIVNRTLNDNYIGSLWCPLAAGDVGVRTVTDTTLGATGQAVGEYTLSIVRPLAQLYIPQATTSCERECYVDLPKLPRIYDDSCLALYFSGNTASSGFRFHGEVFFEEN